MSMITDSNDVDGDETHLSSPHSFVSSIRFIGFWAAVMLPFLYVPLLVNGLDTAGQQQTFFLLLLSNVVALVFGHRHRERD
ncbi:hypothetical protein [Haladaptatus sp. W1]|uniref:hypothetical protein n=2 Tax=unclassified Haladaptatus TaxID=2622732 RepID=UPI0020C7FAAB|nr:hypothetical protein [Haladaptatus sp. W1]